MSEVAAPQDGHGGPDVTEQLASFVAGTRFGDLPKEVIELAKRCILDGTAVMIAGSTEPCAKIARDYVKAVDGVEEATIIGSGDLRAPVHLAALANGVAGHALDWDDTALSLEKDRSVLIHPTMQPLCASLAVGEHLHASGTDFLTAFILGLEVQVKIAEAIHPDHFTGGRGFHSSGTIGVFGAVVAASKLMALSRVQTRNALAIAATMSSGLGVNHGTMAKPLNVGRAAESGVTAARLASLGFDGPANALEGGRGFFEAFGGGFDETKTANRLGNPFAIVSPGISVKPYPSGVVGHPGMDAMRKLVTQNDIDAADIDRIHVKTGPNVINPGPLRVTHATTALEAKFCVPFQMAAIALRRQAGPDEFSNDFVQSDACQDMQRKVAVAIDPAIAAMGKDKLVFEITVATHDGSRFSGRSDGTYRGGPANPLTWGELCQKFLDGSSKQLDHQSQERFMRFVEGLDSLDDVSGLLASVVAPH